MPILGRQYVVVLDPSAELLWPFHIICPSSACMCCSQSHPWSPSDHFTLFAHPWQAVCGCFWFICGVALTIPHYLPILRVYVIVLDPSVKSLWPFYIVCPSLVCMWLFLIHLWSCSDHSTLSAHLQDVCGCSWSICKVPLTILHCMPILSLYVVVFNPSVKSFWPSHVVCSQLVCGCSQSIHEVVLTISPCLSILSWYVVVLNPSLDSCSCFVRLYVIVCTFTTSNSTKFPFFCMFPDSMYLFLLLLLDVLLILQY